MKNDNDTMELPGFYRTWHDAIVRHADLDPNGHVTNSVICAWFDDGRYKLLLESIKPRLDGRDFLALATTTINFRREVHFIDRPRIGTVITALGRTSMTMTQALFCHDICVATATSVTVVADGETRRPKAPTQQQRDSLLPFLHEQSA